MRFAIFGDIHANLEALSAVLEDAREQRCTEFVCLGDVVGYNADPTECLKIIQSMNCAIVKGNHDEYASTNDSLESFNPLAESAIRWTRQTLSVQEKTWLNNLPLITQVADFTVVHASLDQPSEWTYVLNQLDAAASFARQRTQICFLGHTHVPQLYVRDKTIVGLSLVTVVIEPPKTYCINVGSVGQPRDGDWRASYAIFDLDQNKVALRRVPYDITATQEKILRAGLPRKLADRLLFGR
jgi:predicted phosphodiesterase